MIRDRPDAPKTPSATEGDASATVSFEAPASNNSPITGYTISWNGGAMDVNSAQSYPITGLTNGTGYSFTVVAHNAKGDSTASAPSATITPYGVPGPPASASLSAAADGTGALTLDWAAPGSNGGRSVSSYEYTWVEGGAANGSTSGGRSATATGNAGTQYRYQVRACNARACGEWATSNAATPVTPPPPWTASNPATVTATTCPESKKSYDENNLNSSHGCTDNPRGYLQPGTVVDAICHSVRRGVDYYYFTIEDGSYDGWFIRMSDTTAAPVSDC